MNTNGKREKLIHSLEWLESVVIPTSVKRILRYKADKKTRDNYKSICRGVHCKQIESLENKLGKVLEDMFEEQIGSAALKLSVLREKSASQKSVDDTSDSLARQIFDPREWHRELINRVVPILAVASAEAMRSQVKLIERGTKAFTGKELKEKGNTTASDYLERFDIDLEDVVFTTPYGDVSMQIATEFPAWMKDAIQDLLTETFQQPYWEDVNLTTLGDITGFLRNGLIQGKSIEQMAKDMRPQLLEDDHYAKVRGRRIARTESGHALNGARNAAFEQLKDEVGDDLPIKKSWLSVLGTTTRLTHANLDGVPADSDGLWILAGVRTRWPSDVRLPANERINCQCTIVAEWGMLDAEAAQLIDEYNQRVMEEAQAAAKKRLVYLDLKHLPGQHSQLSHGGGGGKVEAVGAGFKGFDKYVDEKTGIYYPSEVGKFSGTSFQMLSMTSPDVQAALAAVTAGEKAAANGDWDTVHKLSQKDYGEGILGMKYQGAFQKLKMMKDQQVAKETLPDTGWKKIGGQLGSQPGGVYEMGGKKYYVKQPNNPDRARNEVLGAKLYEAAGAGIVKAHLVEVDGKLSVATEWEETEKLPWSKGDKVAAAEDFAIHAWTANWDAVGHVSEMENIKLDIKKGELIAVDVGGTLNHRATEAGGMKEFGSNVPEWNTLRDPNINPSAAQVFGDMTPKQLYDSAQKLKNITDEQITELVDKYGNGTPGQKETMAAVLRIRKKRILQKADDLAKEAGILPKKTETTTKPATEPKKPEGGFLEFLKPDGGTVPPSVPSPPPIKGKANQKFNQIYEVAKNEGLAGVEKFNTNPNAKSPYPKKLHEYKLQLLASLKAGGKVSTDADNVSKTIEAKIETPKIKINPAKFPKDPTFTSSNQANVQANTKLVSQAKEYASKGDMDALKSMDLPPSNKLKEWHGELVANLSDQLNPPPPPKQISESYKEAVAKLKSPEAQDGLKNIGYWAVTHELGGIPQNVPEVTKNFAKQPDHEIWKQHAKQWPTMSKDHEKRAKAQHLKAYTGGGYHVINGRVRAGNMESIDRDVARQIIEKSPTLPEGLFLSRKHGLNFTDLKTLEKTPPGTIVSDKGFLSTSVDKDVWHGNTHWRLTVGHGVKGVAVNKFSSNEGEQEIVLPPNQRIMITGTKKEMDKLIVHGIVLPTEDNQCCN